MPSKTSFKESGKAFQPCRFFVQYYKEICLFLDVLLAIDDVDALCRVLHLTTCQVINPVVDVGVGIDLVDALEASRVDKCHIVDIVPSGLAYESDTALDGLAVGHRFRTEVADVESSPAE